MIFQLVNCTLIDGMLRKMELTALSENDVGKREMCQKCVGELLCRNETNIFNLFLQISLAHLTLHYTVISIWHKVLTRWRMFSGVNQLASA